MFVAPLLASSFMPQGQAHGAWNAGQSSVTQMLVMPFSTKVQRVKSLVVCSALIKGQMKCLLLLCWLLR